MGKHCVVETTEFLVAGGGARADARPVMGSCLSKGEMVVLKTCMVMTEVIQTARILMYLL